MGYSQTRQDAQAAAGAFLENELRQKLVKSLEKLYPEYHYARIVPVSFELDPGAETYRYDLFDRVGDFDLVADAADDLPLSDVKRGEVINSIRQFGGGTKYTTDEVRKAQFSGIPLQQRRIDAMRMAYEERMHRTCLFGYAGTGLKGFFNHPAVDRLVVTGTATDGWFDAPSITPDQMNSLLNEGVTYQGNLTGMVETPDSLLLPYTDWRRISSTPRSSNSDTTVLEFFLKTNGTIKNVEPINELDLGKSFGNLTAKRMIYYKRDPSKLEFHISMPLSLLPPEPRNLAFIVNGESKTGGFAPYYPKSITYVDKG